MATTSRLCSVLLSCACVAAPIGCGSDRDARVRDVPVRVQMVAIDQRNSPVVILEEEDGPRVLPIWIGTAEATSIAAEINNQPMPRPNFHDMAKRLIQNLDAEVERVVVTELREGTYYALLSVRSNGRSIEIDVRPSDGIAVALRTKAPIFVRDTVFDDAGEVVGEPTGREIRWNAPDASGNEAATSTLNL